MERLIMIRKRMGISQQTLAALVGVTRQAIGQYESGRRRPTGDILVNLAHVLGVSSAYLLELNDSPERTDGLSPGWQEVVEQAIARGFSTSDVMRGMRMLEVALAKDK